MEMKTRLYKPEVLRKCDLFSALDARQLSQVEKISATEEFEAGAILCQHGALANKLYVIKDGWVQIFIGADPQSCCHLQTASRYDVVGWTAMLEPYVYTATVKAIEKTTAIAFDGALLLQLCREHPDIGYEISLGIARAIAERLHYTYNRLAGTASLVQEKG